MANTLNMDLTGKVVILRKGFFREGLEATDHPFLCEGGFGCLGYTEGRMLAGTFISDGEETAVSGYDVERLATDEEIARFKEVA